MAVVVVGFCVLALSSRSAHAFSPTPNNLGVKASTNVFAPRSSPITASLDLGWSGRQPIPGSGGSQYPHIASSSQSWASEVPGSATAVAWANDRYVAEGATPPGGLLDPSTIGKIYSMAEDDPVLTDFFADYYSDGPMAAMSHLGTPGVTTRLSALMGQACGINTASNGPFEQRRSSSQGPSLGFSSARLQQQLHNRRAGSPP
mmetsp:Transcript_65228/g.180863  ORF Transcript_65228/g.180863 Transcript_65228/m.180863 type:complete len:203 (-) Transcript_65228:143-751(-)